MRRASQSVFRSSPVIFIGALLAGAFLVLVSVSLVQEFRRRAVLQQHMQKLRTNIEAREQRIGELKSLQEYLATDAYVERAAREKLNYRKTGEAVVVVPTISSPRPAPSLTVPQTAESRPWREWLVLLFGPGPARPFGGGQTR